MSPSDRRGGMESQSVLRSHSKPGLPPVSSAVLDDFSNRSNRLHWPATADQSAVNTPYKAIEASPCTPRSPFLDLQAKLTLPVNRLEAMWSCWVVVFGFDSSQPSSAILQRFQYSGDIVQQVRGAGNWLFLLFDSPLQAERASASKLLYLDSHVLAGVQQMNASLARLMNVSLSSDGQLQQGQSGEGVFDGEAQALLGAGIDSFQLRRRGRAQAVEPGRPQAEFDADGSLYIKPRRKKSICERIADYFWSY